MVFLWFLYVSPAFLARLVGREHDEPMDFGHQFMDFRLSMASHRMTS